MAAADDARGNNVLLHNSSEEQHTLVPHTPTLQGGEAPLNPFFMEAPALTVQEGRSLLGNLSNEVCCLWHAAEGLLTLKVQNGHSSMNGALTMH